MHGNVMELVEDQAVRSIGESRLVTDTHRKGIVDPWSRARDKHVVRGGSWSSFRRFCRIAWRGSIRLAARLRTVAFRLVRTAPPPP
jgi:formylglycine-generating enzyme required for sulfatase activity